MISKLGLNTSAPYHFLLYSLTFGGGVFHSFIVSPIAFKNLKREEFGLLQNKVFPIFFLGQTISPVLLALSAPLTLCPFTLGLLSISGLSGAANYFLLLPWCKQIKEERSKLIADKKHEKIENGEVKPTDEYKRLNSKFGKYHGVSTLINLLSIGALGFYGIVLSKRLIRV